MRPPWPRPILEWAARYPLLAVVPALPLVAVWGGGDALGLPSLFLDFWAGLSVVMLLGEINFVGYLLDADEPWAAREGGAAPSVSWYFWATFTFPFLLVLGVLPAALAGRWSFLIGAAAAVGCILFLNRMASYVQARADACAAGAAPNMIDRLVDAADWLRSRLVPSSRKVASRPRLHALQFLAFVLTVAGYGAMVIVVAAGVKAPPGLIICLIAGLGAQIYGLAHFVFPLHHFGAVVAVFLLGAFAWNVVGGRPGYGGLPGPDGPDGRLGDVEAMDAWRSRWSGACGEGPQPRLVVVATSGGGIRAASWTAELLQRMERAYPHFRRHVRLVTGASGGMVAAGAWVASLERDGARPVGDRGLAEAMEQDSLSDLVREMLVPFRADRGSALERALIDHTGGVMGRTFLELKDGEAAGWRPSLVFSPMVVEDGRRLLVTNLALDDVATSLGWVLQRGGAPPEPAKLSRAAYQLFADYPGGQAGFTVASGARMSASFPWVSPAAEIPPTGTILAPRRVVDAGYYDNYGVDLAAAWIHERRDWLARCTSGVLLVQIRDSLRLDDTLDASRGVPLARAELASPVEGLLTAREASMVFRNDGLIHIVGDGMNAGGGTARFATLAFESSLSAPLSWNLTPEDVVNLRAAADAPGIAAQIAAMKDWLSGTGSGEAAVTLRDE